MPSRRISKQLNAGIYFLTMTIHRWYYLFDRHNRWKILADSIRYCQQNKELTLHAVANVSDGVANSVQHQGSY